MHAEVQLLIGISRDESRLFNAFKGHPTLSDAGLLDTQQALCKVPEAKSRAIVSTFSASCETVRLGFANEQLHDAVASVQKWRMPAARFAASHLAAVYHHFFERESSALREALGACHALEIPVFLLLSRHLPKTVLRAGARRLAIWPGR